ncbi:imidazole glycerol phosphate synthase subunit HisH [Thalassolituus sp. UBA2009]|jgi:glutamine amidotransferase|uniref:imidazole glycerol phosphate synthase subunit HisH n=1 Tax=Thalassolituus sp. UBA2009 TaxID=1947658 RepID=UPI000C5CD45B|nr:imidazole glycerol phosphate synthase subunit HisH [Thalassolituus sp. UBA2009]MAY15276.1 imidazole glycerol phosphate synthase subunit HisH [Oceanospirillaceae bacterium]
MSSKLCAVIDYGMGNLHSAHGALQTVAPDTKVVVTSDADVIRKADHVVLPGVGAIRDCMAEIRRQGIDQVVAEVRKSKPLLGICVGLQAMMERSEENGGVDCMGLFPGEVKFFGNDLVENGEQLKVPHMGWNRVEQVAHPLWAGIADNSRFYFVHSYYVQAANAAQVKGRGHYGVDFAAAMGEDNVFAVQFHPEKSHNAGLALLKNFLAWDGQA